MQDLTTGSLTRHLLKTTSFMLVTMVVSRPFGLAAQAGFGIASRTLQAAFLPVVALGFAVAPVAGQNFGARLASRVRSTFTVPVSGVGDAADDDEPRAPPARVPTPVEVRAGDDRMS